MFGSGSTTKLRTGGSIRLWIQIETGIFILTKNYNVWKPLKISIIRFNLLEWKDLIRKLTKGKIGRLMRLFESMLNPNPYWIGNYRQSRIRIWKRNRIIWIIPKQEKTHLATVLALVPRHAGSVLSLWDTCGRSRECACIWKNLKSRVLESLKYLWNHGSIWKGRGKEERKKNYKFILKYKFLLMTKTTIE